MSEFQRRLRSVAFAVADACVVLRNAELRVPHKDAKQYDEDELKRDGKQREADCREHAAVAVDAAVNLRYPDADDAAARDDCSGRPLAPASCI